MAIKDKINHTNHLSYFEGKIPISFRYTYGLAGEVFFRKLKEGKLVASVAPMSDTVYCPPRVFCEDSFEAIDLADLVELPGTGTVETFTVCCENGSGDPQDPVILAFVRFDGADGGFVAPLECDFEAVEIGMRVQLSFVPKKERKGCINDVFFVPAE